MPTKLFMYCSLISWTLVYQASPPPPTHHPSPPLGGCLWDSRYRPFGRTTSVVAGMHCCNAHILAVLASIHRGPREASFWPCVAGTVLSNCAFPAVWPAFRLIKNKPALAVYPCCSPVHEHLACAVGVRVPVAVPGTWPQVPDASQQRFNTPC